MGNQVIILAVAIVQIAGGFFVCKHTHKSEDGTIIKANWTVADRVLQW